MPAPTTYAVQFRLVDPAKMAETHSVDESVVMTITGLVQGNSSNLDSLNARDGSRLINRNLARLTRFKGPAAEIIKAANEGSGTLICTYCSRCGRKFKTNDQCQRCGISFRLSEMDSLVARTPGIPAKVVTYAKTQRHAFVYEPPQA